MSETSERLSTENEETKNSVTDPILSNIEVRDVPTTDETQRLQYWREKRTSSETQSLSDDEADDLAAINGTENNQVEREPPPVIDTPPPAPEKATPRRSRVKKPQPAKSTLRDEASVHMLLERCRHVCISLFYRENAPVRSVGFTSSIAGEGKSFLASVTAQVLAHDSSEPVTLIECNWEHPTLHEHFGIPASPGLAEWLGGTCDEDAIRHRVDTNLTVIPAGNGAYDAVKLLNRLSESGLHNAFKHAHELYIVDLPPIITTGYGSLAAGLLESIVIVVRAQVISDSMLAETCSQLNGSSIHGIILNQDESHIPRWLRQLL
jgi:Mrp family chromosome partitioning ATPase